MIMNTISFVRGDTYYLSRIFKDKEGNILIFDSTSDEISFTVRKNVKSDVIFSKKLTNEEITVDDDGIYSITINSTDTEDIKFGTYHYDIEIRVGEDDFVRTVESGEFELLEYDLSRPEIEEVVINDRF